MWQNEVLGFGFLCLQRSIEHPQTHPFHWEDRLARLVLGCLARDAARGAGDHTTSGKHLLGSQEVHARRRASTAVFLNVSQFVGPGKLEQREPGEPGEVWVGGDIVQSPFWKARWKSLAHGNQSQKRVPQKSLSESSPLAASRL